MPLTMPAAAARVRDSFSMMLDGSLLRVSRAPRPHRARERDRLRVEERVRGAKRREERDGRPASGGGGAHASGEFDSSHLTKRMTKDLARGAENRVVVEPQPVHCSTTCGAGGDTFSVRARKRLMRIVTRCTCALTMLHRRLPHIVCCREN